MYDENFDLNISVCRCVSWQFQVQLLHENLADWLFIESLRSVCLRSILLIKIYNTTYANSYAQCLVSGVTSLAVP